jgi:two-component system, NtrC family, sensor kinase
MTSIVEQTDVFRDVAIRTIADMFGIETEAATVTVENQSVVTSKSFLVSVYYTGTVYGEYLLAMDEATAARVIGIDEPIDDDNRAEVREGICDAIAETLNTIVGESIVHLQQTYAKLTLTSPRIIFGEVRYPSFCTGKCTLQTAVGEIECHFCLDLMRLDLATSYQEAMGTLLDVNAKLKEANRHLAEQQAQLVLTEKMASVGILASGVAHEINNPLFFVDTNLTALGDYIEIIETILGLYDQLCVSLQDTEGQWIEELNVIRAESAEHDIDFVMQDTKQLMRESSDGIRRIKRIVQGLRDFSQADTGGLAEADLNVILENTCSMVESNLPPNCRLERQLGAVPKIVCNAAEISQVVAGILLNAGQAVKDEGVIRLRSESTPSGIVLVVEDNGTGIAPEHIDHIFEPFFTTREEGQGTGLGLSIAYGIIQKHQGSISVISQLGHGTQMTIRLPKAHELANA